MIDRRTLEEALRRLATELDHREVGATLWLVGGAVMVLAFGARESTADVDCSISRTDEVLAAARVVAHALHLPDDWLNDAAKIYIPVAREPDWQPLVEIGSVRILTADHVSMLAMKLRAARGARDQVDIALLLDLCGITTEEATVSLYEEFFPEDPLKPRARPMVRAALESNARARRDHGG